MSAALGILAGSATILLLIDFVLMIVWIIKG